MKHPEIAHEGFASSRFAGVGRRTALVALISAVSIAISFFQPRLALSAYVLLLAILLA
jgi:hypothetical protein